MQLPNLLQCVFSCNSPTCAVIANYFLLCFFLQQLLQMGTKFYTRDFPLFFLLFLSQVKYRVYGLFARKKNCFISCNTLYFIQVLSLKRSHGGYHCCNVSNVSFFFALHFIIWAPMTRMIIVIFFIAAGVQLQK